MAGVALILVGVWLVIQSLAGDLAARLIALSTPRPADSGEGGGFTGDSSQPRRSSGGGGGGAW